MRRLDDSGIAWDMLADSSSSRTSEALVSADLGVFVQIEGNEPPHLERIHHGGQLPDLGETCINLYVRSAPRSPAQEELADLLRTEVAAPVAPRARAA
jgi:hypothetical protein